MSFMTSHTFNDMKETMQLEGVFWLYGAFSFLGLIFIVIWCQRYITIYACRYRWSTTSYTVSSLEAQWV